MAGPQIHSGRQPPHSIPAKMLWPVQMHSCVLLPQLTELTHTQTPICPTQSLPSLRRHTTAAGMPASLCTNSHNPAAWLWLTDCAT